MKKTLLIITLAAIAAAGTAYAGDPVEVWNEVYDSGSTDQVGSVAVDALANVYVTGLFFNGVDTDFLTIKYNPNGDTLWNRTFDGANGNDNAYGIAVDASSNVYVTGTSNNGTDFDWRTIKYDNATSPNVLWNVPYDGGNDDLGSGVAVDDSGYVYVTGLSNNGTDTDFLTICYDSDGDTVWTKTFDGGSGDDGARSVALDAAGNPCVTGYSFNGTNRDYRTICYDSQGNVRWNEFFDGDSTDSGYGIAVDADGYVYVTGTSDDGTNWDFRTIKYDSLGNIEWNEVYDAGNGDWGQDIAVDPYFVYVTGNTHNGTDTDFRTIRYDKEGSIGWNVFFDSGNNESGSGVAVDDSGYVYVTGLSNNGTDWDFRTIKYEQDDYPIAVSEQPPPSSPSSLTFEVVENLSSAPTLNYSLPVGISGTLTFYSADGRNLESYSLNSAQTSFSWISDNPSGVYFAKLTVGNYAQTVKAILMR